MHSAVCQNLDSEINKFFVDIQHCVHIDVASQFFDHIIIIKHIFQLIAV